MAARTRELALGSRTIPKQPKTNSETRPSRFAGARLRATCLEGAKKSKNSNVHDTKLPPTAPERVLLLEVEVEAGCQHKRRPAAAELAHEPRLVGLLVGGQLARPVELPAAPRMGAAVLPAVEPAARRAARMSDGLLF